MFPGHAFQHMNLLSLSRHLCQSCYFSLPMYCHRPLIALVFTYKSYMLHIAPQSHLAE